MPVPLVAVVIAPAHRVAVGKPAKQSGDLVLGLRPNHKAPVVRYHSTGGLILNPAKLGVLPHRPGLWLVPSLPYS
jgi:hypothetical protein